MNSEDSPKKILIDKTMMLDLINRGLSAREISNELGISVRTVSRRLKEHSLQTTYGQKMRKEPLPVVDVSVEEIQADCLYHGNTKFIIRDKNTKPRYRCVQCLNNFALEYSKRNKDKIKNRSSNRKKRLIATKGGACIKCGYNSYIYVLQFHHVNREDKEFTISRVRSTSKCLDEIGKCVLLCATCHAEAELEYFRTLKYRNNKRVIEISDSIRDCLLHGPSPHFIKRTNKNLTTKWCCKWCRSEQVTKNRKKKKEKLVQLLGNKCQTCNYNKNITVLQFHHLVPSQKQFNISDALVKNWSYEIIKEEAQKCILLCPNCHIEVEAGVRSL